MPAFYHHHMQRQRTLDSEDAPAVKLAIGVKVVKALNQNPNIAMYAFVV